jgi:hypothetical protein
MARHWLRGTLAAALLAGLALAQQAPAEDASAKLANKWRIEVSGDAETDGNLVFRVTPNKGDPRSVSVDIDKNRSENGVARDIRDALSAQLSPDRYSVEVDDGEDVLVKREDGQPDFLLELSSTTVKGPRIEIDRE